MAHEKFIHRITEAINKMKRKLYVNEKLRTKKEQRIYDEGLNAGLRIAKIIIEHEKEKL